MTSSQSCAPPRRGSMRFLPCIHECMDISAHSLYDQHAWYRPAFIVKTHDYQLLRWYLEGNGPWPFLGDTKSTSTMGKIGNHALSPLWKHSWPDKEMLIYGIPWIYHWARHRVTSWLQHERRHEDDAHTTNNHVFIYFILVEISFEFSLQFRPGVGLQRSGRPRELPRQRSLPADEGGGIQHPVRAETRWIQVFICEARVFRARMFKVRISVNKVCIRLVCKYYIFWSRDLGKSAWESVTAILEVRLYNCRSGSFRAFRVESHMILCW